MCKAACSALASSNSLCSTRGPLAAGTGADCRHTLSRPAQAVRGKELSRQVASGHTIQPLLWHPTERFCYFTSGLVTVGPHGMAHGSRHSCAAVAPHRAAPTLNTTVTPLQHRMAPPCTTLHVVDKFRRPQQQRSTFSPRRIHTVRGHRSQQRYRTPEAKASVATTLRPGYTQTVPYSLCSTVTAWSWSAVSHNHHQTNRLCVISIDILSFLPASVLHHAHVLSGIVQYRVSRRRSGAMARSVRGCNPRCLRQWRRPVPL